MKTFVVYVLFSNKDKKLYIGYTENLEQRFKDHLGRKVVSTRNRLPLSLIYFETFMNLSDAKSREKFLKSGFGRGQLKKELKTTLENLGYAFLDE